MYEKPPDAHTQPTHTHVERKTRIIKAKCMSLTYVGIYKSFLSTFDQFMDVYVCC